jgi:hypothetical protein
MICFAKNVDSFMETIEIYNLSVFELEQLKTDSIIKVKEIKVEVANLYIEYRKSKFLETRDLIKTLELEVLEIQLFVDYIKREITRKKKEENTLALLYSDKLLSNLLNLLEQEGHHNIIKQARKQTHADYKTGHSKD